MTMEKMQAMTKKTRAKKQETRNNTTLNMTVNARMMIKSAGMTVMEKSMVAFVMRMI